MKGFVYILQCNDGSYYTGSTNNLQTRLQQHNSKEGANYTKKRTPLKLVYTEELINIEYAFHREKQIQGWNKQKKEALINRQYEKLTQLAKCKKKKDEEEKEIVSARDASASSATQDGTATKGTQDVSARDASASSATQATQDVLTIKKRKS
jgi:putative endonuclease